AGLAEVMDGNDVRMAQPGERSGLTEKPFGECRILADLWWEYLERDRAVEPHLLRLVDCAHASLAEKFHDFQLWEVRGQFVQGWRSKTAAVGPCTAGCRT